MDLLVSTLSDIQPGRLVENLILLGAFWFKVRPHLSKIELRMDGMVSELATMNGNMKSGFDKGEARFEQIEGRIEKLETKTTKGDV
jgi:hypothetical protein